MSSKRGPQIEVAACFLAGQVAVTIEIELTERRRIGSGGAPVVFKPVVGNGRRRKPDEQDGAHLSHDVLLR